LVKSKLETIVKSKKDKHALSLAYGADNLKSPSSELGETICGTSSNVFADDTDQVGTIRDSGRKLAHDFPYLVLFTILAGAITAINFRGAKPIGWGDAGLSTSLYNPQHWLEASFYSWDANVNVGGAFPINQAIPTISPMALGWTLLKDVGLPLFTIQALYIFAVLDTAMIFTFKFLKSFLGVTAPSVRGASVAACVGSIAGVINLYSIATYWHFFYLNIALVALTPFLLWVVSHAFDGASTLSLTLISALGLLAFSPAFINLAYVVPILLLALSYAVWRTWIGMRKWNVWLRVAIASGAGLALNAFVYFPTMKTSLDAYGSAGNVLPSQLALQVSSGQENLWSTVRGMVIAPKNVLWLGRNPWWRFFYDTPAGIALGLAILFVAVLALFPRAPRRFGTFGLILFGFGALASMGLSGPTGIEFGWLFNHFPGFAIFRIPYLAFVPFLNEGIAVLIAGGVAWLITYSTSAGLSSISQGRVGTVLLNKRLVSSIIVVLLVTYAFPLSSGIELRGSIPIHGPILSSSIEVPKGYAVIQRYLLKHDNAGLHRVLVLPLTVEYAVANKWSFGYEGPNIDYLLLGVPTVSFLMDGVDSWSAEMRAASQQANLPAILHEAAALGCSYVLLKQDVLTGVYAGPGGGQQLYLTTDATALNEFDWTAVNALHEIGGHEVAHAQNLTLYALPGDIVRPLIYAVAALPGDKAPIIRAKQLNPVEWVVSAIGGHGAWHLVMNAGTDAGWVSLRGNSASEGWLGHIKNGISQLIGRAAGVSLTPGVTAYKALEVETPSTPVLPAGNSWTERVVGQKSIQILVLYRPQMWRGVSNLVSLLGWLLLALGLIWHRFVTRRNALSKKLMSTEVTEEPQVGT